MAKPYRLTLETGSGVVFSFDYEGDFLPRLVPEYKDGANPPEVTGLREVWEIRNAVLSSSDATGSTNWTAFWTFVDRIDRTTGNMPTKAVMTLDPSGTPSTLRTLGPSTHEKFKIEATEVGPRGEQGTLGDEGRKLLNVSVTVSAIQRFADTNGLVEFNQEVKTEDAGGGLTRIRYRTELGTLEGTSAVTKASTLCSLSPSTLGPYYTLETNTTAAVDTETRDDDTVNSRVPTRCVAESVAREWGVVAGAGSGQRPNEVALEVTTETSPAGITTTTVARAKGPGSETWVAAQEPSVWTTKVTVDGQHVNEYSATWTRKQSGGGGGGGSKPADVTKYEITASVTGGARVQKWITLCGDFEALEVEGGFKEWTCRVGFVGERRGTSLTNADIPLPAKLGAPWIYDQDSSDEGQAAPVEYGASSDGDLYRRSATLVFRSPSRPTKSVSAELLGKGVASYGGLK